MSVGAPRVTHVITGLDAGGAETLLLRLLENLGAERAGHTVLSLRRDGALATPIAELGVPVEGLGIRENPTPGDLYRLARALRRSRADVVQTWMLHSNVLAGVLARFAVPRTPVAWGIHLTKASRVVMGVKAVILQRFEAFSSWFIPRRIVSCSVSSTAAMSAMRYRPARVVTITNGFDPSRFHPDAEARAALRWELRLPDSAVVIGHVARAHPVKDHPTLLAAAQRVVDRNPDVCFVLCGELVDASNPAIRKLAEPLGKSVQLLGKRNDVPRLLNAFDIAVSSSTDEALSLAVGEAMATGVPVVATDCGDSRELIGDTGRIVPVRAPEALAGALLEMATLDEGERAELGRAARGRIVARYSLPKMVESYSKLWASMMND